MQGVFILLVCIWRAAGCITGPVSCLLPDGKTDLTGERRIQTFIDAVQPAETMYALLKFTVSTYRKGSACWNALMGVHDAVQFP